MLKNDPTDTISGSRRLSNRRIIEINEKELDHVYIIFNYSDVNAISLFILGTGG